MHNLHHEICSTSHDTHKAREFFLQMLSFTIVPKMLEEKIEKYLDKFNLFDLREYDDYIEGHIPYAEHVPFDKIEENLEMFSKDKINILYGASPLCQRPAIAAFELADKGYPVKILIGGMKGWEKTCRDVVKTDTTDYKANM